MRFFAFLAALFALVSLLGSGETELRAQAVQAQRQSNWKDAFEIYRKLVEDAATMPTLVGEDLKRAVDCLGLLNRQAECDAVIEAAVKLHAGNWRLLQAAALTYRDAQHWGFLVAGTFERGNRRGRGQYVSPIERDRRRSLQLLQQAMPLVTKLEGEERQSSQVYWFAFADQLARHSHEAWRLQYLSDLDKLPDWDEPLDQSLKGAPVDGEGKPVFHRLPESWATAANDGERWRWLLAQGGAINPQGARWRLASAMREQFDVHTLQQFGWQQPETEEGGDPAANPWALEGLQDDETIARLANGPRRFTLPEEFRFIAQLKVIANANSDNGNDACRLLGQTYENRRRFAEAAHWWSKVDTGRAQQITGNWGCFETARTQTVTQAALDFRFRNATKATFTARAVDVDMLLADVRALIESKPKQIDYWKTNLSDLGRRLMEKDQGKYLGAVVTAWNLELKPKPGHADRRISVTVPKLPAGAWLIESQVAEGNASRVLLWLADLALVQKQGAGGRAILWAVDAASGEPVAEANVTGFGWRQRWEHDKHEIDTTSLAGVTDSDGLFISGPQTDNHQWLFTARQGQRRAFLGWSGIWNMDLRQSSIGNVKTLVISDRPAYRPGQVVKCKAWMERVSYEVTDDQPTAGWTCALKLFNPKGEEIASQRLTTDRFGGVQGEFALPADAPLGAWRVVLDGPENGSVVIRVEEYKKPEFAVTVEAPAEAVVLGGKLTATIKAAYYFGAPVAQATVAYKVLRREHDLRWYPAMTWDWLYGAGYWWFEAERPWYPGWNTWGCRSPLWAWRWRPEPPPEVVADGEGRLAADGTFAIEIDSALAKLLHGDADHRYEISAEVTDASRRTIVGNGTVIAARKPYQVTVWADRGWVQAGSAVDFHAAARTPDGKPVSGVAHLRLLKISYGADGTPAEQEVAAEKAVLDAEGRGRARFVLAAHGQYRCSVMVEDGKRRRIEGASMLTAIGQGKAADYRFNDLELTADKREYAPGDRAQLLVGVSRPGAAVLFFERPANGGYPKPRVLRLAERQSLVPLAITPGDMPNCFVEVFTIHDGKETSVTRELIVPPENRTLNVELVSDAIRYKPGAKAAVTVKVSDQQGRPVVGSLALTMYDQALEYISGGPNVPEIRAFFWKWRRHHQPGGESSLARLSGQLLRPNEHGMQVIGCFGLLGADDQDERRLGRNRSDKGLFMAIGAGGGARGRMMSASAPMARDEDSDGEARPGEAKSESGDPAADLAPATVRSNFADAAFWSGNLVADANGLVQVVVPMPENLTGWKLRTWAMAPGTRVGEASLTVTTAKDLLVRLQAPRFFQERDEVVLSANVHNYLAEPADCAVAIDLPGSCLELLSPTSQNIRVAPGEDRRVDWRVKAVKEGEAVVRISARSAKESDAMEQKFPVKVHGAPIQIAWSRVLRPGQAGLTIPFAVPAERRPAETRLEVRWSPTLAGALVNALPYLASYPYGCTEQTLNRFLPTVICQRVLKDLKVDLAAIRAKKANLNAQELGDPQQRAEGWKRANERRHHEPVAIWDEAEVATMVRQGVVKLQNMQLSDGGWGWFSGWGERSSPHLSSLVVRGLLRAKTCGATIDQAILDRGIGWLQGQQAEEVRRIELWESSGHKAGKSKADNLDALVDLALAEAGRPAAAMGVYLWRDAPALSPYGKALHALACHLRKDPEKVAALRKNLEQFLKQDPENQSAWLELPAGGWWWCWYDDEIETQASYLKLLAAIDPKHEVGAGLVKYLLNNRKHATWWNSTRDTALVIDAMADWLKASGEDQPDCTVEVLVDGKKLKEVHITADNLFDADLALRLDGEALTTGEHKLELRRVGKGPLYANAYLSYFSLEEGITKQGLEVKVERAMYRLVPRAATIKAQGAAGQALDQKIEAWDRVALIDGAVLTSGDLIEVELTIESKNDYEYLLFLDPKVAGCEPFNVRSGYLDQGLRAYAEWRDDRSCLFVERLPRGRSSVAWRMRAEIPGIFHALPTRAEAMYAPELRANADELRLEIRDAK